MYPLSNPPIDAQRRNQWGCNIAGVGHPIRRISCPNRDVTSDDRIDSANAQFVDILNASGFLVCQSRTPADIFPFFLRFFSPEKRSTIYMPRF